MSGKLRKRLGPARQRLIDILNEKPPVRLNFNDDKDREEYRLQLRQFKRKLENRRAAVHVIVNDLYENKYEGDELQTAMNAAEEAQTILDDADDVIADIDVALDAIQQLIDIATKREREQRQTEIERQREQHQVELERERLVIEHERVAADERVRIEEIRARSTAGSNAAPDDQGDPNDSNDPQEDHERGRVERHLPAQRIHIRLPKLELSKFDGSPLQWREFWDTFEASVHTNPLLSGAEKLAYLKSFLEGTAKAAIAGLATTNVNYQPAVQILHDRFGKQRRITSAHFNALYDLRPATNDTLSLRSLVDKLEQHLRSLEALGEQVNASSIFALIMAKLPAETVQRIEDRRGGELDTVEELREALTDYVSIREEKEQCSTNKPRLDASKSKTMMQATSSALAAADRKLHRQQQQQQRLQQQRQPPTTPIGKCPFCHFTGHWAGDCKMFKTVNERKACLPPGTCFLCLNPRHTVEHCRKLWKTCFHCKQHHHQSLCPVKYGNQLNSNASKAVATMATDNATPTTTTQMTTEHALMATGESVLLQTACATISNTSNNGKSIDARLLFDTGSQRSYITEAAAKALQLKPVRTETLAVNTFGSGEPHAIKTKVVNVGIVQVKGGTLLITANVVPVITSNVYRTPVDSTIKRQLICCQLAEPLPTKAEHVQIDLLIGNDYYDSFMMGDRKQLTDGLYAIQTTLGWIVSGRHKSESSGNDRATTLFVSTMPDASFANADQQLLEHYEASHFWSLETLGISDRPSVNDDDQAMHIFNKTIRFDNGRYYVGLPWKADDVQLPTNFALALGRLNALVRNSQQRPDFLKRYDEIIRMQLEAGIIEKVDSKVPASTRVHYIPHHGVEMPDKQTTKLRIVYDGSAKTKQGNNSINDCLYRGPVILEDLAGLLMRFRLHQIAVTADIEKAFLQVGIRPEDRDATRFLWLRNVQKSTVEENVQVYRFARVPFGLNCSPFLLAATVKHHLDNSNDPVATAILKNIYVDNILYGASNEDQAYELYTTAKTTFYAISMNVREWMTNSATLRTRIPEVDRAATSITKVLGLIWNMDTDQLSIPVPGKFKYNQMTKRTLLKYIASIFDPLGLLCPAVLPAKFLLQSIWQDGLDWDTELAPVQQQQWTTIQYALAQLSKNTLQRCVLNDVVSNCQFELHGFCDASKRAYGTCIYLRAVMETTAKSTLIFAKARLAPIRQGNPFTIPRLELLAVVIGSRALNFASKQLQLNIVKRVLWTDSKCVLGWLHTVKQLPVFERNRVAEVKKLVDVEFRYVDTYCNPADIASRGANTGILLENELWWHGPGWLSDVNDANWPPNDYTTISNCNNDQEAPLFSMSLPVNIGGGEGADAKKIKVESPFGMNEQQFSKLSRLLRVTAWATRFIKQLKKSKIDSQHLTAIELEEARNRWIQYEQQCHYSDVLDAIAKHQPNELVRKLGLWIDGQNLLRCGGRLQNSGLAEATNFPILLPKAGWFTTLAVRAAHEQLMHAGVSHTLAQLRLEYWIPAGRRLVFSTIRNCQNCKRFDGGPYKLPQMPPLPRERVQPSTAFMATGLDYLGPLFIKSGTDSVTTKVWICLFTCLATRAIHLELVNNMTTEQFLLALRRFVARRGRPSVIYSDNAKQFKQANTTIQQIWTKITNSELVSNFASEAKIQWRFIIERAPWMGGFYERLVRLVKQAIKKSIGTACLTSTQLQTLVTEIEAIINSRPLVYIGGDFETGCLLTPAHFLTLNPTTGWPPCQRRCIQSNVDASKSAILDAWKKGQRLLEGFWKIWQRDYLLSLRERTANRIRQPRVKFNENPTVGDVVLIKNDGPRGTWRIGRIESLVASRDGLIRAASVHLPSGTVLTRSLGHLYPLEVSRKSAVIPDDDDEPEIEFLATLAPS